MEREAVAEVVAQLKAEGVEPGPQAVRERLGRGSYRDIVAHLKALTGAVVDAGRDDDALAQAQQRLATLQDAVPLAEEVVATARAALLNASGRQLTVLHAQRRGWLPADDPVVGQAEASTQEAGQRFRAAQARLQALPAEIAAAQAAVTLAQRACYLQREHAELLQRLADLQADEPGDHEDPGVTYRQRAIWKQALQAVMTECEAACQAVGL